MGETTSNKFEDPDFLADSTSIYGPNSDKAKEYSEIPWLRPHELKHYLQSEKCQVSSPCITCVEVYEGWTVMTTQDVCPEDIIQGDIGNCWFISALAVVAQKPELIEKIILTKEVSPAGVYVIRLCKDGLWHDVVVDDRFPCDMYGRLKYARSRKKQLWVSLIEKAMAKLFGSYEALQAGQSHEGLMFLTGYSSYSMELKFDDDLQKKDRWEVLLLAGKVHFPMGASCGKPEDSEREDIYNKVGLQFRHAYSVLEVRVIQGLRLLKLRNPWGKESYKGDWNIKSALWTPELIKMLQPPPEDHGIFWIFFDELIRYFTYIDICQFRRNWYEVRLKSKFPTASDAFITGYYADVTKSTELEITLHQKLTRIRKVQQENVTAVETKADICVVIFTISKSQFEKDQTIRMRNVGGYSPRNIETRVVSKFKNVILYPGAYLILPVSFQNYHKGIAKDFALSIHSSKSLLVKELSLPKEFLSEAMINFTTGTGTKDTHEDGKLVIYTRSKQFSGISIVVENNYSNRYIHFQADLQGSENLVSSRDSFIVADSVPPLRRQLIVILTHENESRGYRTVYNLKHRIRTNEHLDEDWAPTGEEKVSHNPPLKSQVLKEDIHFPRATSYNSYLSSSNPTDSHQVDPQSVEVESFEQINTGHNLCIVMKQ